MCIRDSKITAFLERADTDGNWTGAKRFRETFVGLSQRFLRLLAIRYVECQSSHRSPAFGRLNRKLKHHPISQTTLCVVGRLKLLETVVHSKRGQVALTEKFCRLGRPEIVVSLPRPIGTFSWELPFPSAIGIQVMSLFILKKRYGWIMIHEGFKLL